MKRGKTPVPAPEEAHRLLDSIDVTTPVGLRDRALIALMVFSFARIGAALKMRVEDAYIQNRRLADQHLSRFPIEIGNFGNLKSGTDFGKGKPPCDRQRVRRGRFPDLRSFVGRYGGLVDRTRH